jgi:hypothetical protein
VEFHSAVPLSSGKRSSLFEWISVPPVSNYYCPFVTAVLMAVTPSFWIFYRLLITELYVFLCFWHCLNFPFWVDVDEGTEYKRLPRQFFVLRLMLPYALLSTSALSFEFQDYHQVCQVFST